MRGLVWVYSSFGLLLFLLWSTPVSSQEEQVKDKYQWVTLCLVWTAKYDDNEQVFFSQYLKDKWTIPVQISSGASTKFHATGTIARNGVVWIAWTQVDKKGNFLYLASIRNGVFAKAKKINTDMVDNREATIAIDGSNRVLLAWTAIDKNYPDIFWLIRNGQKWSKTKKVHINNNVPDGGPSLITDENANIFLSWKTYSDGASVGRFKKLTGGFWQDDVQYEKWYNTIMKTRRKHTPKLPKSVWEAGNATYLFMDSYGAGVLPALNR